MRDGTQIEACSTGFARVSNCEDEVKDDVRQTAQNRDTVMEKEGGRRECVEGVA